MSFWETLPGLIASWAAAIVGIGIIARAVWKSFHYGRRIAVSVNRLIEIGNKDAWPNGSETLAGSITEIYNRQTAFNDLATESSSLVKAAMNKIDLTTIRLEAYIVAHRADHGLEPPA